MGHGAREKVRLEGKARESRLIWRILMLLTVFVWSAYFPSRTDRFRHRVARSWDLMTYLCSIGQDATRRIDWPGRTGGI